ncbi:conserved unknown protein [Ectocarpus siliculosus]|uniref:Uncharacterized protein n=1 Tax=Ectocarpus siliculosus TaxID=2880 RepID=D7FIJ4_ECTSI|nr:conserved unknown protein [Ectocarpus siliculosus]|eukprot:CBJ34171.1 conserved unknown protein [Ectocarpus siliculosus]
MTKTRFTAADVRAMVRDLRSSVLGLRVANVYDLDSKAHGAVERWCSGSAVCAPVTTASTLCYIFVSEFPSLRLWRQAVDVALSRQRHQQQWHIVRRSRHFCHSKRSQHR